MQDYKQLELVSHCKIFVEYKQEKFIAIVIKIEGDLIELHIPKKGNVRCRLQDIKVSSGYEIGDRVIAKDKRSPLSNHEEGIVIGQKVVAGQELAAIYYYHADRTLWVPFERLAFIQNQTTNFLKGSVNPRINHAERFRLKTLAYGIQLWNQNTGSLSSLDIDPLPHQINLVHHILESGNLNWLIADDVGLGKTIETGMLITALKYREQAKRILLVTPAGLTKQWKDELYYKFSFEDFRIYGDDFTISEPREWRMYDHVVASIDSLKRDENLALLAGAGHWDLIIFDEAHRLTRSQSGNKFNASGRYDLAKRLRNYTENLLLLTATPHQGKPDQFKSLLSLLRPELDREINNLNRNPEILSEMVYRNNKSKVTDLEGKLIFKGKITHPISLSVSEDALEFDTILQVYLRKSAEKSDEIGGKKGRAIGFVIAIYRKLAASSISAILNALKNRKARLFMAEKFEEEESDERFAGEFEEKYVNHDVQRFTDDEEEYLDKLIAIGERVKQDDLKLQGFLEKVIEPILESNPKEKIVIFTEYLSTQKYLQAALNTLYGETSTSLINGSMTHEERASAIQKFNGEGQFIISTEAGGEGINLQHHCHILVNFDLPWNPMRLVQRIGRIYRYGQEKEVIVFNIFSEGTADDGIVRLLYQKIDQVVNDLGAISDEFDERLKDDIFGNVADLVDVGDILEKSLSSSVKQTEKELEAALVNVQAVSKKQQELFSYVAKYDAKALEQEFVITLDHVNAFLQGMFDFCEIEVTKSMYDGDVLVLKLPEKIMKEIGTRRQRLEVTTNRRVKMNRPNTEVMDLNHPLMHYFIELATSYRFEGASSKFVSNEVQGKAIITAIVKWQNIQGTSIHKDILTFALDDDGYHLNPGSFSEWLLQPTESSNAPFKNTLDYDINAGLTEVLENAINLKRRTKLIPHDAYLLSGAWIEKNI